jgi:hypothetical protein
VAWSSPSDSVIPVGSSGPVEVTGLELQDNTEGALDLGQGVTSYVIIDTVDGLEKLEVLKDAHMATGTSFFVNTIAEETADLGVTIDGLRIKDERIDVSGATVATGDAGVTIRDNLAQAFTFKEASDNYLVLSSTDSAEKIQALKRFVVTDNVSNGTERIVGGLASVSAAASAAITGATEAETVFSTSYSMPADTLKVGTKVVVRARGTFTAITGTETCVLRLKFGSAVLSSTGNLAGGTTITADHVFIWEFEFECRATGASGTVVGHGRYQSGVRSAAPTVNFLMHTGSAGTATTTVDTTPSTNLTLSCDWQAVATDSNSVRLDGFSVWVYG